MTAHLTPAPVTFVHTKVTLYRSNLVDLRVSRTVHSCDRCSANQGMSLTGNTCGAVHYGRCTPVTLVSAASTPARSLPAATPTTPPNTPSTPPSPRTMVNVVHIETQPPRDSNTVTIETQPRDSQTVTLGTMNSPITVGIPPRGFSPITIETSPRKSPSPSRTITFETQAAGKLSPRQVTIETFPAAALSPRNVAMEIYPRRGSSPIRSLSPRSFVIETYPPNATMPKTFTIETRPIDAVATQRNVTMTTRNIPIEIRPSVHNKSMASSAHPGTSPRYLATNTITIPVTKSRVPRVPGIPTGLTPHHAGGAASPPRRPASLDGLVSMVNGHGSDSYSGVSGSAGSGSSPGGGAGIGSRAIPAPVTSIPKLPASTNMARVSHTVRPPTTVPGPGAPVRTTHYNLHRVPNYIRIAAADNMRAQEAALAEGPGPGSGSPGDGRTPAAGQARSPVEDDPSSPGSPTLHVLRQVTTCTDLSMIPAWLTTIASVAKVSTVITALTMDLFVFPLSTKISFCVILPRHRPHCRKRKQNPTKSERD